MAKEISLSYTASSNLYAVIKTAAGQYVVGATPEAFNAAHWANYAIALTEYATATGQYSADFPALAAGAYCVEVYLRVGGSPTLTDGPSIAEGELQWDGTAEVTLASRSTYAGGDTAGTTTLLSRVPGTVQPQTGDAFARLGANGAGLTSIPYTGPAALTDYQQRGVAITLPANPPAGFLATASYSTTPGWYTAPTAPPTVSAIRTEIDTNSTKLAAITASLATFSGLQITGVVAASPIPTASTFVVTLDTAMSVSTVAADIVGLYLTFRSGAREPSVKPIAACTINSTTSLTLMFTGAFAGAPTAGDMVSVSS